MKKRICIIEDEQDIVRLLMYNLEKEGYKVYSLPTGEGALKFAQRHQPHLILLDLMIPGMDGFEVCKLLKNNDTTKMIPIIMLTAKTEESTIVTGLELGADDYITKPFSVAILIARVRIALRRKLETEINTENVIEFENLKLCPQQFEISVNNKPIEFNLTEFQLLACLMSKPGRVFTRMQIIDFMKGENYFVTPRLVDVLLVSIRKKLGESASLIQTVRGVGYKMKAHK